MRLLEYLVPSRARREVLQALRSQDGALTVRELSRETGVAYSGVHRELEQMEKLGLARLERRGNAVACTWNAAHPAAKAMEALLGDPGEETVFWNLRRWGAPLVRPGTPGETLSLESTLAYGLRLARSHSDVARVWPVVLAKNLRGMDLPDLVRGASRLGQKRALGFFLELTGRLLGDPALERQGARLRDERFRSTQDFFVGPQGGRARKLAERRTPALAKAWGLRMNMPLDTFESSFEKFVEAR